MIPIHRSPQYQGRSEQVDASLYNSGWKRNCPSYRYKYFLLHHRAIIGISRRRQVCMVIQQLLIRGLTDNADIRWLRGYSLANADWISHLWNRPLRHSCRMEASGFVTSLAREDKEAPTPSDLAPVFFCTIRVGAQSHVHMGG